MVRIASARRIAALFLVIAGIASAQAPQQTTLPPTNPTALPTTADPLSAASTAAPQDALTPAKVSFADGKLQVIANSSSLNQILREIARLTSITITGGVKEERVYGTYGPAAPGEVLDDLLDGTGINMLYRESTTTKPGELILTQRNGGPTPPNPNAQAFDDRAPTAFQQRPPYSPPYQRSPPAPPQPNAEVRPTPAAGASTGPQSPEQIYQQLQRIQQAQPHQ
jgi:hypothetical protein